MPSSLLNNDQNIIILLLVITILIAISANLALYLLRRHRSRQMLMERVAEQEALIAAGQALVAAELDIDALCRLIAEQAGQVIDNRTFQVGLFNEGFYDIRYWTIDGQPQNVPQCFNLGVEQKDDVAVGGLVGWV